MLKLVAFKAFDSISEYYGNSNSTSKCGLRSNPNRPIRQELRTLYEILNSPWLRWLVAGGTIRLAANCSQLCRRNGRWVRFPIFGSRYMGSVPCEMRVLILESISAAGISRIHLRGGLKVPPRTATIWVFRPGVSPRPVASTCASAGVQRLMASTLEQHTLPPDHLGEPANRSTAQEELIHAETLQDPQTS